MVNKKEVFKMDKQNKQLKAFSIRMPRDTWLFLKNISAQEDKTMTDIICRCVDKFKKRTENKLTDKDT